MTDEFINKINEAVDRVIEEENQLIEEMQVLGMEDQNLNHLYNLCHIVLRSLQHFYPDNMAITLKEKNEIINLALDVFKYTDQDFYEYARNVIMGKDSKIKFYIYDADEEGIVCDIPNEDGIPEYTRNANMWHGKNGNVIVHVPINEYFTKEEKKDIPNGMCTITTLNAIIHEVTHLFDYNFYGETYLRAIVSEVLPITFEMIMGHFLLERERFPEQDILENYNDRRKCNYAYAEKLYFRLGLARRKKESGIITKDDLISFQQHGNLSKAHLNELCEDLISSTESLNFYRKYVIAGLIAPKIFEMFLKNPKDCCNTIKECIVATQLNDYKRYFELLGIELSEEGIRDLSGSIIRVNEMFDNFKEIN